jgi:aspartate/methionine/tyrosine aminotransferase
MRRIRRQDAATFITLLLSSPENPTGSTWTLDALDRLAVECADLGAVLVLDHSFAVAGVHDASRLTRVWDMDPLPCEWMAVWDTGKTFGFNEDKLGFILCGTSVAQEAVDAALAVMQFGVARRQKLFFAELLRRAFFYGHLDELRHTCLANLATASSLAGDVFSVLPVSAGSLLLLDVSAVSDSDEVVRRKLLDAGIGVVAGNVFFHSEWRPDCYIRVALARRHDYFDEAMRQLIAVLKCE